MSEDLLQDLETVNDDFKSEIEAEKAKAIEEAKKNAGIEDEEEDKELDLQPLKSEGKLDDIKNLSLDNIEEFLKNNGKAYCDMVNEKNSNQDDNKAKEEKDIEQTNMDNKKTASIDNIENKDADSKLSLNINNINLLNNFTLNEDIWKELNLDQELQNKVLTRVKLEIKSFIKSVLIPFLEGATK